MSTTHTSEAANASLIQRRERVFAAQFRATQALHSTRSAAWDAGSHGLFQSGREEAFAADVTAALADLVQLALGVEDQS